MAIIAKLSYFSRIFALPKKLGKTFFNRRDAYKQARTN